MLFSPGLFALASHVLERLGLSGLLTAIFHVSTRVETAYNMIAISHNTCGTYSKTCVISSLLLVRIYA
jgi:hypothetical protein